MSYRAVSNQTRYHRCAAEAVSGPVDCWPNNYNRSFLSDFTPFFLSGLLIRFPSSEFEPTACMHTS